MLILNLLFFGTIEFKLEVRYWLLIGIIQFGLTILRLLEGRKVYWRKITQ